MKKKEKSWYTMCLVVFLVMEIWYYCFICRQDTPDAESVLSCCMSRVGLEDTNEL